MSHELEPYLSKVQDLALNVHSKPDHVPSNFFFVYYCDLCDEVLIISRSPIDVGKVNYAFRGECPGCRFSLDLTLQGRSIPLPFKAELVFHPDCSRKEVLKRNARSSSNLTALHPFLSSDQSPHLENSALLVKNFDKKPVLKGLTFGDKALDNFLGYLPLGKFIVFYGSQFCHIFSELLCVKAQLPLRRGGLNSTAIFIDGGNIFDPYLISRFAQNFGLDPEQALIEVLVSRAFTPYQLTALIMEKLPEALGEYDSRLVVVSDPTKLYSTRETEKREAKNLFNHAMNFLAKLVEEQRIIILVSHLRNSPNGKCILEPYLIGRAHILVNILEEGSSAKISLERHPYLPLNSMKITLPPDARPVLEDFFEVKGVHG